MTTDIIFADVADDDIYASDATYATARAGSSSKAIGFDGTGLLDSGQTFGGGFYRCVEAFISFDTSIIGTDDISAAVLALYGNTDKTATDFTNNARLYDWGATVTTADFIAGASLSAQTLLAHFATTGFVSGAYNTFTDDAMPANINKAGFTRMVLCSSRQEAGTTPTGNEIAQWVNATNAGTTLDPKLTVTHAAAAGDDIYPFAGGGYYPQ